MKLFHLHKWKHSEGEYYEGWMHEDDRMPFADIMRKIYEEFYPSMWYAYKSKRCESCGKFKIHKKEITYGIYCQRYISRGRTTQSRYVSH